MTCQNWDSQSPHSHGWGGIKEAGTNGKHNYCRNPDGSKTIWCYTTNTIVRWDYCTKLEDREVTISKENTFINAFGLEDGLVDNTRRLVVSCYFALTTLSTVGYGDYYPISNEERLIAIVVMIGGVAFFSYTMGNFIEIITNYDQKMGDVNRDSDLNNYLMLLSRFNNNQLPKSL